MGYVCEREKKTMHARRDGDVILVRNAPYRPKPTSIDNIIIIHEQLNIDSYWTRIANLGHSMAISLLSWIAPLAAETVNPSEHTAKTARKVEMAGDGGSIPPEHRAHEKLSCYLLQVSISYTVNMRIAVWLHLILHEKSQILILNNSAVYRWC